MSHKTIELRNEIGQSEGKFEKNYQVTVVDTVTGEEVSNFKTSSVILAGLDEVTEDTSSVISGMAGEFGISQILQLSQSFMATVLGSLKEQGISAGGALEFSKDVTTDALKTIYTENEIQMAAMMGMVKMMAELDKKK